MELKNIPNRPKLGNNSGRVIGGIVVMMIGFNILNHRADLDLPDWLFAWPMILVIVGLYIGSRDKFRFGGWLAVTTVGAVFLADDVLDTFDFEIGRYFWPVVIIGIGLYMIFKPRRRDGDADWSSSVSSDDVLNTTAVFGGTKVNVLSKNFKGGEISTVFGGTDINLAQADFQGSAVIYMSTAFGGVKIIAPAHWNIKSEVVCIFGGIDDKRKEAKEGLDASKTLVLKGSCMFGGLEIKSF